MTTNLLVEVIPERIEYIGPNEVLVSLKTKTGDAVSYTMTTAMLTKSINLGVALFNSNIGQVLRDLDVSRTAPAV
jgi:hypothetical protein